MITWLHWSILLGTIVLTWLLLRKNQWIKQASAIKLVMLGTVMILGSIILYAGVGNRYPELIVLTTVISATIVQINYAHRTTVYRQTGR